VKPSASAAILLSIAFCALSATAAAQQIRRWVDDNGVVHYSEVVPPEYADRDRDVLNRQGIAVGFEEGLVTAEERAELARLAAEEEARRIELEAIATRDKMLLDTYLSVEDIEDLRDRRLELMESQIKVTEQYLGNLRKRLGDLQREAERFAESAAAGTGLPPELALDISRTTASISLYEENLNRTRAEQDQLHAAFSADITRFIELKGQATQGNF
jgi:hypothetical protein